MYIEPGVVSLGGGGREVSVVTLASDLVYLTSAFSDNLVNRFCIIRPSIVLADGVFGSSLAWVFECFVIPLY